jgi:hypothetical protein
MGNGVQKIASAKREPPKKGVVFGDRRENIVPGRPESVDLVISDATHPEWEKPDCFVFCVPPDWRKFQLMKKMEAGSRADAEGSGEIQSGVRLKVEFVVHLSLISS